MSYSGDIEHDFVRRELCYYFAGKRESFLSSTRNMRGEWKNENVFAVTSYGVPIAVWDNGKWLISERSYSKTTNQHRHGVMQAINDSYEFASEEQLREIINK